MNIDEILDGLQKSVDELKEERMRMISLEERVMSLIAQTEQWFAKHAYELSEKGG